MAMVKPIALTKNAFDATNNEVFSFTSTGGDQIVKNKITIRLNSDNSIVYTNTLETFAFNQTVPSGTLTNGLYYNYFFNTYNISNDESPDSNIVPFYCFTTPTLSLVNVSNNDTIESSNYIFIVEYDQEQGELLDSLKFILYNINGEILSESDTLYSTQTPPFQMSHLFEGMENNTSYQIQVIGNTINGTSISSDRITFEVRFENPAVYTKIDLENKCDEGYVQFKSNLVFVDAISNPDPPIYINDESVDLGKIGYWVEWLQGYEVPSDFVLELWMKPALLGEFCKLWNNSDLNKYIKLNLRREVFDGETEFKDCFEVYGLSGSEYVRTYSNKVDLLNNLSEIIVWVKKINNVWELTLDVKKILPNTFIWNEPSNVEFNKITNIYWNKKNSGVYIRYSANPDGSNMTITKQPDSKYVGIGYIPTEYIEHENLLLNSEFKNGTTYWGGTNGSINQIVSNIPSQNMPEKDALVMKNTNISTSNGGYIVQSLILAPGVYTLSSYVYADSNYTGSLNINKWREPLSGGGYIENQNVSTTKRGEWVKLSFTSNLTLNDKYVFSCAGGSRISTDPYSVYGYHTKLERGPIATDWTPSPADWASDQFNYTWTEIDTELIQTVNLESVIDENINTLSAPIAYQSTEYTSYIRYSPNSDGSSMTETQQPDSQYRGIGYMPSEVYEHENLYLGTKYFDGEWMNMTPTSWSYTANGYNHFTVASRSYSWSGLCQNIEALEGEAYTFTAYIRYTLPYSVSFAPTTSYQMGTDGMAVVSILENNTVYDLPNTWIKCTVIFEVTASGIIRPSFERNNAGGTLDVCSIKLEKGKIATDWTPTPSEWISNSENYVWEEITEGLLTRYADDSIGANMSPTILPSSSYFGFSEMPVEVWDNENLFTGTEDFSGLWINKSEWTYTPESYNGFTVAESSLSWKGLSQNINTVAGEKYTFSAFIKYTTANSVYFSPTTGYTQGTNGMAVVSITIGDFNRELVDTWVKVYVTVEITSSGIIRPSFSKGEVAGTLEICGLKLEKGEVTTPWTPTPSEFVNNPENYTWKRFLYTRYADDLNGTNLSDVQLPTSRYKGIGYMPLEVEVNPNLINNSDLRDGMTNWVIDIQSAIVVNDEMKMVSSPTPDSRLNRVAYDPNSNPYSTIGTGEKLYASLTARSDNGSYLKIGQSGATVSTDNPLTTNDSFYTFVTTKNNLNTVSIFIDQDKTVYWKNIIVTKSPVDHYYPSPTDWVSDITNYQWTYIPEPEHIGNVEDVFPITNTKISNGIFDHINITKDINVPYSPIIPTDWNYDTILDCDFNNNINGGNTNILLSQLQSLKIKRRELGTFNWVTLKEIGVSSDTDLNIVYQDSYIPSFHTFQWALVPILNGSIESEYIINQLETSFNGVFISNKDKIFKLYNAVGYGSTTRIKNIGIIQTIGNKYPTFINNSIVDYEQGEITATLYGYEFEKTRLINPVSVVTQTNDLLTFLNDGTAKIITDWNGNIKLVRINPSPTISYNQMYGNRITTVTFQWTEQGAYNNQDDLYNNELIDVLS